MNPLRDMYYSNSSLLATGLFTHIDGVYTGGIAFVDVSTVKRPTVLSMDSEEILTNGAVLWPNPASDYIHYRDDGKSTRMHIVDKLGNSYPVEVKADHIDTGFLANGHYMLIVGHQDGSIISHPFIIMR
jgi:hypothetical protein